MKEFATVTRKGQVTIPKSIRAKLGLEAGKKVSFELKGREVVMSSEVDNPLEELRKMREEVSFEEEEIQRMKKYSKKKWSKLS